MGLFKRSCFTNYKQPAPNPDPSRWKLLEKIQFPNAYVLRVKYLDCTNFEGEKIMVYKGRYKHVEYLDPHFRPDNQLLIGGVPYATPSPIARFRPDSEGLKLAVALASIL